MKLNELKIGQIVGKINDTYDDEYWNYYNDKFGNSFGFEMALHSILMDLVEEERYRVLYCVAENIELGRESTIFVSMYLATIDMFEHKENPSHIDKFQNDNVWSAT